MANKKIALMDSFKETFTEGENFIQYAKGFCERGCDVFQIDPYTFDFEDNSGVCYDIQSDGSSFIRSSSPYLEYLRNFDVIMDLSDIVDLDFAKNLIKVPTFHINNPISTYESANKSTYPYKYEGLIPKTVVSSNFGILEKSLYELFGGEMIVKDPLGCCGKGIEKITPENVGMLYDLTKGGRKKIVAQEFMSLAYEGSKRVAVIGNVEDPKSYRVIHFYGRKPLEGNWKDNLSQGGEVVELDKIRGDEEELCLDVARKSGLYLVGLDIMDDLDENGNRVPKLIETNAVLAFSAGGKFSDKLKIVPNFILEELLVD